MGSVWSRADPVCGHYFDPKHGGCLRWVRRTCTQGRYEVVGVYGSDEPNTGRRWTACLSVSARGAVLDFVGKPEKMGKDRTIALTVHPRSFSFADGNTWHKMHVHPSMGV